MKIFLIFLIFLNLTFPGLIPIIISSYCGISISKKNYNLFFTKDFHP